MHVEIQARGFELSENLENHIHKKVTHALQYANTKVRKVIVRLFNEDARHNQKTRTCRILVSVKGMPDIITNYRANNIYKASNAAIKASSFTIKNRLNKIRKLKNIKRQTQSLITN
ncbi:MAG: HPF/RaiA family ribosome-associated protein [Gammaproteobacteria bacterium]|nr:HPF/RaiA family ribosome-associated protein [Gammaproteobacteria bacterium]